MSYQIRKEQKSKFLAKKNLQFTGLKMKPKLRDHAQFIEVKEIIIVYPSWQEKAMKLQFQVAYRRLFKLVMDVIEDNGSTAGDTKLALNEIHKTEKICSEETVLAGIACFLESFRALSKYCSSFS